MAKVDEFLIWLEMSIFQTGSRFEFGGKFFEPACSQSLKLSRRLHKKVLGLSPVLLLMVLALSGWDVGCRSGGWLESFSNLFGYFLKFSLLLIRGCLRSAQKKVLG